MPDYYEALGTDSLTGKLPLTAGYFISEDHKGLACYKLTSSLP